MTYFNYLHPAAKAIYYGLLFLCLMIVFDPAALVLALVLMVLVSYASGSSALKGYARFFTVLAATIVLINFAFNHRGSHVLFYVLDRPMTLESLLYGAASALLIICIILLFRSVSACVTTAEFLYLFAGSMPELGMLVSMTCGFFQAFAERGKDIQQAVRMKNIDIGLGTLRQRSLAGMQIMNVLIALTLENALMTVMSMKTRAFELKKRKCGFSYNIRPRDVGIITVSTLLAAVVIGIRMTGLYQLTVYPSVELVSEGPAAIIFYGAFIALLLIPGYRAASYRKKLRLQKEGSI